MAAFILSFILLLHHGAKGVEPSMISNGSFGLFRAIMLSRTDFGMGFGSRDAIKAASSLLRL